MEREKEERREEEEEKGVRRGPWRLEEDLKLVNHIALHGHAKWNSLPPSAGLKRSGKSCRLRWLNYLRPDIRRGNITLQEQLIILQLHSLWGNRWSKIAQYLPGRTDNEIKNYWRTRVQKHAKLLRCDVNSKQFKDTVKYVLMPRLLERIAASNAAAPAPAPTLPVPNAPQQSFPRNDVEFAPTYTPDNSSTATATTSSSGSSGAQLDVKEYGVAAAFQGTSQLDQGPLDQTDASWFDGGDASDSLWNVDDFDNWFVHQQQQFFM